MKVKDLISHLRSLDQDRGIFILYDDCEYFEPVFDSSIDRLATRDDAFSVVGRIAHVHEGDYLIIVG